MTELDRALAALQDPNTKLPCEPGARQFLDYGEWCQLQDQIDRVWKRAGRKRP